MDSFTIVLDAFVVVASSSTSSTSTSSSSFSHVESELPEICAIYKNGGTPLNPTKLAESLTDVRNRVILLRQLIEQTLSK